MKELQFTRRRFLGMASTTAASVILAACSPQQPTAEPKPPATAVPQAGATPVPATPAPAIKATTIRHWHVWGGPPHATWLEAAIKEFNSQYPQIKVETTYVGGSGYNEKVNTAIAGGQPPDVLDTTGSPKFGIRKMLINLVPLFEASTAVSKKDFPAYQIVRVSWGNEIFGIPREADCNGMLWWNKDVFAEVGLDPEKPPKTWAEMVEAAKKTTKTGADGTPTRIGFMPTYSQSWFYLWLWMTGKELFEPNPPGPDTKPTVLFDCAEGEKTLDYMVQLSDVVGGAQVMSSFQSGFQSGAQAPFWSGQLAMMINGDWDFGPAKEYAPNLKFGVTAAPIPDGGKIVTSSGGYAYSIPVGGQVEPSWAYIEYLTCGKTSLWRAKETRKLPAHLEAAKDPFFSEDPLLKVANELVSQHGHGFPETPFSQMWNRVNVDMRDEAIFHKKTVKQALSDAANDLRGYIDEYYASVNK